MIALVLALLLATPAWAGEVVSYTVPLFNGSDARTSNANLIASVTITAAAPGDTFLVLAEAEGAIIQADCFAALNWQSYGTGDSDYAARRGCIHYYPMYVTSGILAWPGEGIPLSFNWFAFPSGFQWVSLPQGTDISHGTTYYTTISRSSIFTAPTAGSYTFGLYLWGGSTGALPGDTATAYPGTINIRAVHLMP